MFCASATAAENGNGWRNPLSCRVLKVRQFRKAILGRFAGSTGANIKIKHHRVNARDRSEVRIWILTKPLADCGLVSSGFLVLPATGTGMFARLVFVARRFTTLAVPVHDAKEEGDRPQFGGEQNMFHSFGGSHVHTFPYKLAPLSFTHAAKPMERHLLASRRAAERLSAVWSAEMPGRW